MKTLTLLFSVLLMGCVNLEAMDEEERVKYLQERQDQKYRIAEKRAEALDKYIQMSAACKKSHGIVVRTFTDRDLKMGRVDKWDLKGAGCISGRQLDDLF